MIDFFIASKFILSLIIRESPRFLANKKRFNEAFIELLQIAPTVNSVNNLVSETDELEFAPVLFVGFAA